MGYDEAFLKAYEERFLDFANKRQREMTDDAVRLMEKKTSASFRRNGGYFMRYYSTQRPLGPGTFPRQDGTEKITNFDGKLYCEEIGREAWGYIEYHQPITENQAKAYELTASGSDGCVLVGLDNSGRMIAFIAEKLV